MTKVASPSSMVCLPVGTVIKPEVKHRRRYCRADGCSRIVKSQGLCQRHGAKPRTCKVTGCDKQAQGNFKGMCKSHFNSISRSGLHQDSADTTPVPKPVQSIYDQVIPATVAWNPSSGEPLPLMKFLQDGFESGKPAGWHRNEERTARGVLKVQKFSAKFEAWERELAFTEIMLLTGRGLNFDHFCHAWGREKDFHASLTNMVCSQRGNAQPRKRANLATTSTKEAATPPTETTSADPVLSKEEQGTSSSSPQDDDYEAMVTDMFAEPFAFDETEEKMLNDTSSTNTASTASMSDDSSLEDFEPIKFEYMPR